MDKELIDILPDSNKQPETPEIKKIKKVRVKKPYTLIKGKLIAQNMLKGMKPLQAVQQVGYNTNDRETAARIAQYTGAREYLNEFVNKRADKMLGNLERVAQGAESVALAISESIDGRDLKKVQALNAVLKTQVQVSQDLLDRAGISKISKHMTVKKNIDNDTDEALDKRIADLEALLQDRPVTSIQPRSDTQSDKVGMDEGVDIGIKGSEAEGKSMGDVNGMGNGENVGRGSKREEGGGGGQFTVLSTPIHHSDSDIDSCVESLGETYEA